MTALHDITLSKAAERLADGEISSVELVDACLARIESVDPAINAFISIDVDGARAQAASADSEIKGGNYRSPLHGIPIAVKDIFDVEGVATTAASRILAGTPPASRDSATVAMLRDAGAIILGKLNLHEFAYGATGVDSHVGPARNAWDTSRVTGGSSSGSGTAVAAGECFGALGTDTGGSIRIPASLCGIVGLKPTFGRVSRRGVFPLSWSLDHVGPMARTVEDVAIMLQVIAGHDSEDRSSIDETVPDYLATLRNGVSGLRIGLPDTFFFDNLQPEVAAGVGDAIATLEELGAEMVPVSLPFVEEIPGALTCIMLPEALAVHRKWMLERPDDYSENVRYRLELGSTINAVHYVEAQRFREMVISRWREDVFGAVDLVVSATTQSVAPPIDDSDLSSTMGLIRLTNPLNFLGIPAISVPCGVTSEGLPFGLQFGGRWWDEATVLRAAYAYEQASPWKDRRPELSRA
jgi:aspartyl-tRNA(Asn)/glutamyl-tRNA(Gln) amidotransferase subunit A